MDPEAGQYAVAPGVYLLQRTTCPRLPGLAEVIAVPRVCVPLGVVHQHRDEVTGLHVIAPFMDETGMGPCDGAIEQRRRVRIGPVEIAGDGL